DLDAGDVLGTDVVQASGDGRVLGGKARPHARDADRSRLRVVVDAHTIDVDERCIAERETAASANLDIGSRAKPAGGHTNGDTGCAAVDQARDVRRGRCDQLIGDVDRRDGGGDGASL